MSDATPPTSSPILPGAEPFSASGGDVGVLVCHGFTGTPQSMRPLAEAFAVAGFTVELPLWPGHGTTVEDMLQTTWADWSAAAEAAYQELAGRCERVLVAGLSMGGTLAIWLAAHHPEIIGAVLVNPMVEPPAEDFRNVLRGSIAAGVTTIQAIGSDIADPAERELAYELTPLPPALTMFAALDDLQPLLPELRTPILLFTSPQDHVVPAASSDLLAATVPAPVERVTCARSYHVATLDYDKDEINQRAVDWAKKR